LALSVSLLLSVDPTAPRERHTLSLHDALPIFSASAGSSSTTRTRALMRTNIPSRTKVVEHANPTSPALRGLRLDDPRPGGGQARSEEHTSELQSRENLVCRLLLEKKNKTH